MGQDHDDYKDRDASVPSPEVFAPLLVVLFLGAVVVGLALLHVWFP
jgi:hypothetical protein